MLKFDFFRVSVVNLSTWWCLLWSFSFLKSTWHRSQGQTFFSRPGLHVVTIAQSTFDFLSLFLQWQPSTPEKQSVCIKEEKKPWNEPERVGRRWREEQSQTPTHGGLGIYSTAQWQKKETETRVLVELPLSKKPPALVLSHPLQYTSGGPCHRHGNGLEPATLTHTHNSEQTHKTP